MCAWVCASKWISGHWQAGKIKTSGRGATISGPLCPGDVCMRRIIKKQGAMKVGLNRFELVWKTLFCPQLQYKLKTVSVLKLKLKHHLWGSIWFSNVYRYNYALVNHIFLNMTYISSFRSVFSTSCLHTTHNLLSVFGETSFL